MMKILLWHPKIDAEHDIVSLLESHDIAVLVPLDLEEAEQLLLFHQTTMDLVVIHRETESGYGDAGIQFLRKIKKQPAFVELPVILSTEKWDQEQCIKHQESEDGFNAYLKSPFKAEELLSLINALFGKEEEDFLGSLEGVDQVMERTSAFDLTNGLEVENSEIIGSEKNIFDLKDRGLEKSEKIEVEEVEIQKNKMALEGPNYYQEKRFEFIGRPTGDALIPGGVAQAPDLKTLKKYLELRELDVAILSGKLKTANERISKLEEEKIFIKEKNDEISDKNKSLENSLKNFEKDQENLLNQLKIENEELKFKLKTREDKFKITEKKYQDVLNEKEALRERVRIDLRKIKMRESELELQLEILQKDTEVLVSARENLIIELKRKLDLSEFNVDLLHEQVQGEKKHSQGLKDKLNKAIQAMQIAEGLLDSPELSRILEQNGRESSQEYLAKKKIS